MDIVLELLTLKVEVAKLKMQVELPHGKSLNPAYVQAERDLIDAESNLAEYLESK